MEGDDRRGARQWRPSNNGNERDLPGPETRSAPRFGAIEPGYRGGSRVRPGVSTTLRTVQVRARSVQCRGFESSNRRRRRPLSTARNPRTYMRLEFSLLRHAAPPFAGIAPALGGGSGAACGRLTDNPGSQWRRLAAAGFASDARPRATGLTSRSVQRFAVASGAGESPRRAGGGDLASGAGRFIEVAEHVFHVGLAGRRPVGERCPIAWTWNGFSQTWSTVTQRRTKRL